jgi:hypothetical protein
MTTAGDEVSAAPPHTKIIVMIIACLRGRSWEKARGCLTEAYRSTERALRESRLAATGRICRQAEQNGSSCGGSDWFIGLLNDAANAARIGR